MDDAQYREMKRLILDLSSQVSELKLQIKRMEDTQTHRHRLIYQWCAPASYKAMLDREPPEPIDLPDDLRKFFPPEA